MSVLSLVGHECFFHPVTFFGKSDYHSSNACHFIYIMCP